MQASNDNKARFDEFHAENPHVYELVKHYAKQAIQSGHKHYGMKSIMERVRWHTSIETNDTFKINNNHSPYYARMFMDDYPQHAGFFHTRKAAA